MTRPAPRGLVALTIAVLALLHAPVLVLAVYSFNRARYGGRWAGFTLDWYRRLLERSDVLAALRVSLTVAVIATVVATGAGTMLALALARHRVPRRTILEGLLMGPVVTPEIVMGIALLLLFRLAALRLGIATISLAHIGFCVPFVTLVVRARLAGMDRALEEAALTLGADEWAAFRRVTLPLLLPGIVAGALLAFTMSIDDFVITFFVSGPGSTTLPVLVYSMARRTVEPTINAASTLLIAVATLLVVGFDRLSQDQRPEAR